MTRADILDRLAAELRPTGGAESRRRLAAWLRETIAAHDGHARDLTASQWMILRQIDAHPDTAALLALYRRLGDHHPSPM